MALAAFKLVKCIGANAATEIDSSKHPCFLSSDLHSEIPANYPVARPQSALEAPNYSMEVWLRYECTVAPDNQVENIKVWGPNKRPDAEGSPANQLTIYIGTTATGATPTDAQSTVALTRQDTNHYEAGNALALPTATGDSIIDAVGEKTNYLVLQLAVDELAATGDMQTQTFFIQYEES